MKNKDTDTIKGLLFDQKIHIDLFGGFNKNSNHVLLIQNGNSIVILNEETLESLILGLQEIYDLSIKNKKEKVGDMHG